MPRNMSFMLTTEQIKNKTKTVTRRLGWWKLKPGEILNAVEKSQGLKKGEKVKVICQIKVISAMPERLNDITNAEVKKEGFIDSDRHEFMNMFMLTHKDVGFETIINRIEFKYL